MGHNTKTMNRQAAVDDARSKVRTIAKTVEALTQTLIDEDKKRIVRFKGIETRLEVYGRQFTSVRKKVIRLEDEVRFLKLPFWKQWQERYNEWRGKP